MPLPVIRQSELEDLLNNDQTNGWKSVAERFKALRLSIGTVTGPTSSLARRQPFCKRPVDNLDFTR